MYTICMHACGAGNAEVSGVKEAVKRMQKKSFSSLFPVADMNIFIYLLLLPDWHTFAEYFPRFD